MAKIAIVGSREKYLADPAAVRRQVFALVQTLPPETIIVSGGANGVDAYAIQAADEHGLITIEYPADWDANGKAAGMVRNRLIVAQADVVHAFWDGTSRGTLNTITVAERAGKTVHIHTVNGKGKGAHHG